MKEELAKLWREYEASVDAENRAHFDYCKKQGWLHLYSPTAETSFKGFMAFVSKPHPDNIN